jgi:hypothetical protein
MFFRQLFDPLSSTLMYLIADDTRHEAALTDPVAEQTGLPVVRGSLVRA